MSSSTYIPPTPDRFAAVIDKLKDLVETKGWAVMLVAGAAPVAYTVGMTKTFGLPELAISGLDVDHSHQVLNSMALRLSKGELTLEEGKHYDEVFEGFPARFRKMLPAEVEELRLAHVLAPEGAEVTAWQLHWPDPKGLFWDEPAADPRFAAMQNIIEALEPEPRTMR